MINLKLKDQVQHVVVSSDSFGHSGFTGTYAWADPEEKIIYVFLSNRTYPSMENTLLIDHSIRTRIQKIIYDSILIKKIKIENRYCMLSYLWRKWCSCY